MHKSIIVNEGIMICAVYMVEWAQVVNKLREI